MMDYTELLHSSKGKHTLCQHTTAAERPSLLFAGLGLDSSVSQKWPKYYLTVQWVTPVSSNRICRIKCSPQEACIRHLRAWRDPAEHEVMMPHTSKTELTSGCPDSSHDFYSNLSFWLYTLSVICGVSPPCPHHLYSIRLIVLYNLYWCMFGISSMFMLPYFDYPISKPMLCSL